MAVILDIVSDMYVGPCMNLKCKARSHISIATFLLLIINVYM